MIERISDKMEIYKKKLKKRILFLALFILLAVIIHLGIYNLSLINPKANCIFEFQSGIITGLGAIACILIARYRTILQDEKKLRLQYNKENDERYKTIQRKAGMPMLLLTSALMTIAGIIVGYFNITIFFTLIIAALCQVIIGCIVKIVYMKKI